MSYPAVAFFVVALAFGVFGFSGPLDAARTMARVLFALFLAFAVLFYFLNRPFRRSR